MKTLLTAAAFAALMMAPAVVQAEEVVAPAEAATSAEAASSAAVETAADTMIETTLKDGTKVVIEGDMVSVVGADGAKTPAPDGEHELADGTKVTTKDGKKVMPEGEAHEGEGH